MNKNLDEGRCLTVAVNWYVSFKGAAFASSSLFRQNRKIIIPPWACFWSISETSMIVT